MELDVKKITNKIIHIKFSTQMEMGETLVRYQEYYESPSPKFRGKIFTLGQIRKWYVKTNGTFSYSRDWGGYNLPSFVLKPFKEGWFDPLTEKEQEFLDLFKDREDKFYILGTCEDEDEDGYKDHELLHALYHINKGYRKKVNDILKKYKLTKMFTCLKKQGYCSDIHILKDEVQAYLGSDASIFDDNNVFYSPELSLQLKKVARSFLRRVKK